MESGLRPQTIDGLIEGLPFVFQAEQAKGIRATWHFVFSGASEREITVRVQAVFCDRHCESLYRWRALAHRDLARRPSADGLPGVACAWLRRSSGCWAAGW